MTVPSATNRVNYTGNGVTTAFSFPYIFYDEDHLKVYIDSVLQTSGYTITGAGVDAGGTVTFTSPPAVDEAILIRRVVGYVQDTDFENFDGNPSDVTEKQFDLLAMQTQQLADESARSLKLREDDPTTSIELPLVADRANMFLAFDSLGNPTASSGATSSGTTFGATGEDLAATATPALARTVLGLGTMATQAASAVAITGGTITGITDLAPADGGTGLSTYTTGDILYASATNTLAKLAKGTSGQFLKIGASIPEWAAVSKTLLGTAQATTSGTSIDFTGIPSGTKRITISFVGVSTNGTDNLLVQIGDAGGIENSGYLGAGILVSGAASRANYTAGFGIRSDSASNVLHGQVVLTLVNASTWTWACSGQLAASNTDSMFQLAGSKSLTDTLTQLRITTTGGANTFDAGTINIIYEYE